MDTVVPAKNKERKGDKDYWSLWCQTEVCRHISRLLEMANPCGYSFGISLCIIEYS